MCVCVCVCVSQENMITMVSHIYKNEIVNVTTSVVIPVVSPFRLYSGTWGLPLYVNTFHMMNEIIMLWSVSQCKLSSMNAFLKRPVAKHFDSNDVDIVSVVQEYGSVRCICELGQSSNLTQNG